MTRAPSPVLVVALACATALCSNVQASSPAPAAAQPCSSGELEDSKALHKPLPIGASLRRGCRRLRSSIVFYVISKEGLVESPKIVRSSGCRLADSELLRCMSVWRFQPATCNGEPISLDGSSEIHWGYGANPKERGDPCAANVDEKQQDPSVTHEPAADADHERQ